MIPALIVSSILWSMSYAPQPIFWSNPGQDPFQGTAIEAQRLFVENGIPEGVTQGLFEEARSRQCWYGQIENGEHFVLMTFGRNRVITNVVAETDQWPASVTRQTVKCTIDSGDTRYSLIYPIACGNWSIETHPLHRPPMFPILYPYPPLVPLLSPETLMGGGFYSPEVGGGSAFGFGYPFANSGFGAPFAPRTFETLGHRHPKSKEMEAPESSELFKNLVEVGHRHLHRSIVEFMQHHKYISHTNHFHRIRQRHERTPGTLTGTPTPVNEPSSILLMLSSVLILALVLYLA